MDHLTPAHHTLDRGSVLPFPPSTMYTNLTTLNSLYSHSLATDKFPMLLRTIAFIALSCDAWAISPRQKKINTNKTKLPRRSFSNHLFLHLFTDLKKFISESSPIINLSRESTWYLQVSSPSLACFLFSASHQDGCCCCFT